MTLSHAPSGGAGSPSPPAARDADDEVALTIDATPLGVRAALLEMRARFGAPLPFDGSLGMAETVLAEVLNNVVEHAYRKEQGGRIELRMKRENVRLCVDVRDYGGPMPGGQLPDGSMPEADFMAENAPEGGFGWFLIRAFARDLRYVRAEGQNRLTFTVPLNEDR